MQPIDTLIAGKSVEALARTLVKLTPHLCMQSVPPDTCNTAEDDSTPP